ncbi:nuclear transport factor 2 family protein [Aquimarina atlantica]|nr:nuclear transport factor 2 family protein [Aquimarina atlantica]
MKYILLIIYIPVILLTIPGCNTSKKTMNTLDIIKSTYEGKTAEENGKNLQKHLSENINWTETKGFPYAGTYSSYKEIVDHVFSRLAAEWIDYKFTVEDYVAVKNKVVAYGTYSGTYKKTNQYFEARVAHIWKLKNNKIISFEQFVDSKSVVDAMKEEF